MSSADEHFLTREDSLEYFIKFPPPISAISKSYPSNGYTEYDFNFAFDEANTPIVLLLGWAGCQDRYLMKYSQIYEERGLITIRYTAPVENVFWKRDAMKPIGQKIVKLLCDMNFDANPIILHVFSNGGAYLYQHIDLAIEEFQTPLDICVVSWLITLGLAARWVVEKSNNPYRDLKYLDNYTPQLFLYSNTDKLILPGDVESFASFRQSIGVPVETVCFNEAEHVKLFIKYPQKYIQCVCTFITNCLTSIPIEVDTSKKFN